MALPPGPWTPVNSTRSDILAGNLPIGSGFKVALFQSTSNLSASSTTYAGLTNEVGAANGYTTGGIAVTLTDVGTTSVAVYFASSPGNPGWVAVGGSITAYYAVLFKISGDVMGWCYLDSTPANVVTTVGNALVIKSDNTASNPVFTLA
jgi:hypothetical protein